MSRSIFLENVSPNKRNQNMTMNQYTSPVLRIRFLWHLFTGLCSDTTPAAAGRARRCITGHRRLLSRRLTIHALG